MNKTILGFLRNEQKSGLCLINWPTGRGKTTKAEECIHELSGERPIFYITPLTKNVDEPFEHVRELFKAKGEEKEFDKLAIRLKPTIDIVIEKFDSVSPFISDEIKEFEEYTNLENSIIAYAEFSKLPYSKTFLDEQKENVKSVENKFRRKLCDYLMSLGKTPLERLRAIRGTKGLKPLIDLYPAIECCEKKIFFMTTIKFYLPNSTLIEKPYSFIDSEIIKNSLVFMDEFDACKEAILSNQIEESSKNRINNLFGLIGTIRKSFDTPISEEFFCNGKEENENNNAHIYNFLKEAFIKEDDKRFNLVFKSAEQPDAPISFIYKDEHMMSIQDGKQKKNILVVDKRNSTKNIIQIGDYQECDWDDRLEAYLASAKRLLTLFVNGISKAAINYNSFAKNILHKEFSINESIQSCLKLFGIVEEKDVASLSLMCRENVVKMSSKTDSDGEYDFYKDGFAFNALIESNYHSFETRVEQTGLNVTPESFLIELMEKSFVVGLSATAKLESSISNFDLKYIRKQCGGLLYEPSLEDIKRIDSDIAELMKDYHPRINVVEVSKYEKTEDIKRSFEELGVEIDADYLVNKVLRSDKDDHNTQRLYKVGKCCISFLKDPDSKALLVLTNANLKKSGVYSMERLQEFIECAFPEMNENFYKVISLTGEDFAEKKDLISEYAGQSEKLVVVSSYPTTGSGQNLCFDHDGVLKDFDYEYLECPTNVIVDLNRMKDCKKPEKTTMLLRYLHQVCSLAHSDGVSERNKRIAIQTAFHRYVGDNSGFVMWPYQTESANLASIKILVQATGRISRVKKKSCKEVVFVDEDIVNKCSFEGLNPSDYVEEFQEVLKYCVARKRERDADKNSEVEKLIDNSNNWYRNLQAMINELFSKGWDEESISLWNELRSFVVRHLVCKKEDVGDHLDMFVYSDSLIDSYGFALGETGEVVDLSFDRQSQMSISDSALRLDIIRRNKELTSYLNSKGFVTRIERSECILNPALVNNIYKGAIGEAIIEYVLRQYGIALRPIRDTSLYEMFDFEVINYLNCYVDAKYWSESSSWGIRKDHSYSKQIEKIAGKIAKSATDKAIVINVFGEGNPAPHKEIDGKLLVIPTLFVMDADGCPVYEKAIKAIKQFLEE